MKTVLDRTSTGNELFPDISSVWEELGNGQGSQGVLTDCQIYFRALHSGFVRWVPMQLEIPPVHAYEKAEKQLATWSASTRNLDTRYFEGLTDAREAIGESGDRRPTSVAPIIQLLSEIEDLTGLPIARIAAEIFDVSRTAYYAWKSGQNISVENERRIRAAHDVLQRASRLNSAPELLRGWLSYPRGGSGTTPQLLLKLGQFDQARLYAVTSPASRDMFKSQAATRSNHNPTTLALMRRRASPAIEDL